MCDKLADTFRDNVKRRMQKLQMTQAELARRMNVTRSFINQMLTGHRDPGLDSLQSFADALDTTPSELLDQKILARSA